MTYDCPPPTIPRLTDKQNEPIKSSKPTYASSVPTTQPNGYNSFPPQNSTTTLPLIAPLRHPHSHSFMVMNLAPILLWGRLSFLLSKNNYPNSMKPEKKPSLLMTPLENSCPPEQPIASIPGRSEIRSGSRLPILDCTTLPGNSPPKDMAPSKSFRYYLPSLTNSDFPPHGKYTMYSMPPSYLPIAPLNHMVLPSLCLPLTSSITKKSMKWKPSSLTSAPSAPIAEDCT